MQPGMVQCSLVQASVATMQNPMGCSLPRLSVTPRPASMVASMDGVAEGTVTFTVMKWKTVLAVFVVVVAYLVAGGLLFSALEQPFESNQKITITAEKAAFLERHSCVTPAELEALIKVKLQKEEKNTAANLPKLTQKWRTVHRQTLGAERCREIEIVRQSFERVLDHKDSVVKRLVGDLNEAEQQFGQALHAHLHCVDCLLALQASRLPFFQQQWHNDLQDSDTVLVVVVLVLLVVLVVVVVVALVLLVVVLVVLTPQQPRASVPASLSISISDIVAMTLEAPEGSFLLLPGLYSTLDIPARLTPALLPSLSVESVAGGETFGTSEALRRPAGRSASWERETLPAVTAAAVVLVAVVLVVVAAAVAVVVAVSIRRGPGSYISIEP
ncbi:hypothetical protein CRUP_001156 [Coryphaenoides rupestris]|nr:hypothetical protein CRUP_001156 [Coryphaenoides rupestris]